jgi:P27 family predicted phage terminase small subunit
MVTRAVSANVMEIGKKGSGKHWTAAEVTARQKAAEEMERKTKIILKAPDGMSLAAKKIWNKKIKEASGVNLLDVLDEESLAVYCESVVEYQKFMAMGVKTLESHKVMQAYSRIIAQYADKLGFTPAARARLIKKRAEEKKDDFGAEFD